MEALHGLANFSLSLEYRWWHLWLLLGIAAIVSLVVNRRKIGAALVKAAQRLFSPVGFFGLVIVVFMVISVLESGNFSIQYHTSCGLWVARLRAGPRLRPGECCVHAGEIKCHTHEGRTRRTSEPGGCEHLRGSVSFCQCSRKLARIQPGQS